MLELLKKRKHHAYLMLLLNSILFLVPQALFAADAQDDGESVQQVNADDSISFSFDFTVPEGEETRVYLAKLFGNMPGALSCEDITCGLLVPAIFNILNLGIMTIGAGVLAYVIAMTTALSAVEGEFLGKRYSSFWLPVRSAVGVSILVPGPSGYSILQVMLMNLILYGVGLANNIYQTIDSYGQVFSISTDKTGSGKDPGDFDVITSLDIDMVVMNSFPAFLAVVHENQKEVDQTGDFQKSILSDPKNLEKYIDIKVRSGSVHYIINSRPDGPAGTLVSFMLNANNLKGTDITQLLGSTPEDIGSGSGVLGQVLTEAGAFYADNIEQNLIERTLTNRVIDNIVENYSFQVLEIIARTFKLQSQNYLLRGGASGELDNTVSWLNVPRNFHQWLSAGSRDDGESLSKIYFEPRSLVIDQSFNVDRTVINGLVDPQVDKDYNNFLKEFSQKIADQETLLDEPSEASNLNRFTPRYNELKDRAPGTQSILIDNLIVRPGESKDPLLYLVEKGQSIIEVYTGLTIAISLASLLAILISGYCKGCSGVSDFTTMYSLITLALTITQLFALVLPIGITLAFYLPLMPIMIYSLSVLAWFMQVVEAMVAAPIITLGLLAPSQEGMGKAAPSLLLTLNIVLRPAIMLIGLVMGAKLFAIFAVYFTEVMSSAILFVEKLFAPGGSFFLVILGWVWALMYVSVIVSIAQRCYSLIYVLPDRTLTWIGGQAVETGREITSELQQVQQTVDKGAQAVTQIGTLPQKSIDILREYENANRRGKDNAGSPGGAAGGLGGPGGPGGSGDPGGTGGSRDSGGSPSAIPSAIPSANADANPTSSSTPSSQPTQPSNSDGSGANANNTGSGSTST